MPISEANALLEIISKVSDTVNTMRDNYNQASNDMKAFPLKMQEFEEKKAEWVELMEKYPVHHDNPMRSQLQKAADVLQRSVNDFQASKGKTCCWMLWNKVSFPQQWSSSLSEVNEAFDSIAKGMKDRCERKQLVEAETNMIKAPFRFFPDGKYVPLEETVRELRQKLERDDSTEYVTILYGESGQGKSTLAKHMALTYYSESKSPTSSSLANTFPDGVYFLVCGRNADSKWLLVSLGEELGCRIDEPPVEKFQRSELGHQEEAEHVDRNRTLEVDNLKRKLIARLGSRIRSRLLIILDDVWEQQILGDVVMPMKTTAGTSFKIQYLVTTQRKPQELWPEEGVACVQIGKPSAEEAKRILGNHIGGWGSKRFPADIQDEIESLVKYVDNNPLILANLATVMSSDDVHNRARWKDLRKELITVLKDVDESNRHSRPIAFGEPYKRTVLTSLKMAVDNFPVQAQTMLDLLIIGPVGGIDESVLKVWFKAIYGKCNGYSFRRWSEHLKRCSFISLVDDSTDSKPLGVKEATTRWCVHDLRYQLLREMRSVEIETITVKLTGGVKAGVAGDSSGSDSELLLGTALCFLYGSSEYRERAASNLELYDRRQLTQDWSFKRWMALKFIKCFLKLLNPEYEEGLQEKIHAHAKKVILQYLKSGEPEDIRGDVVELLHIPEAILSTCYALSEVRFYRHFRAALDQSATILLEAIHKHLGEPPKTYDALYLYLRGLESCIDEYRILIPQCSKFCSITRVLLQWPLDSPILLHTGIVVSVLKVLRKMSAHSSPSRKKFASVPDLVSIILNLMRSPANLDKALVSISSEVFLQIACKDEEIKTQTILLPGVLETIIPLLERVPGWATLILKELAWTPNSAEHIASHPGALDGLVKILMNTPMEQIASHPKVRGSFGLQSVEGAIDAMVELICTKSNQTLLLASWPGMLQLLVPFLNGNVPAYVLSQVANLVQKITHGHKVLNQRMRSGLAEVLEKYELLLGGNVHVKSRNAALAALWNFGSDETTRTALVTRPNLLEHMINNVDVGDPAGTSFIWNFEPHISIRRLFIFINVIDNSKVIFPRKTTLMLGLVLKSKTLMVNARRYAVEPEASKLLISATTRNPEIRDWVLTEPKVLEVLFSVLEKNKMLPGHGPYVRTLAKVLLFVTSNTRGSEAKSEVARTVSKRFLKNLFRLLEDDTNTELQAAVIRILLMLTCRQEIHQIIVAKNHILERAIALLLYKQGSSSILEPAAWIVQKCFEKERRFRIFRSYAVSLTSEIGADRQAKAALGLAICSISERNLEFMVAVPGALDSIVRLVSREATSTNLIKIRQAVQVLCEGGRDPQHRDGKSSEFDFDFRIDILRNYISLLADDGSGKSQAAAAATTVAAAVAAAAAAAVAATAAAAAAAESLAYLLLDERNRQLFPYVCLEGKDILLGFLDRQAGVESSPWSARFHAVMCLTLLDPEEAEEMDLSCSDALHGRGMARTILKLYDGALADYDRSIPLSSSGGSLYCNRAFVRAQMGETAGALEDLDHSIKWDEPVCWLERGIFKIIMKDYDGALSDLNKLLLSDEDDYEGLKHRSYVQFLQGDEDGARFDAEHAIAVEPLRVRLPSLCPTFGTTPVRFLEFDLR